MYVLITSLSNICLTGATIPWSGRCISRKRISVGSPPYLYLSHFLFILIIS
ncbi:hypothetical protein AHAS_Ahas06G0194200 [Arachis hypogaea]